jgi:hypothetical protein
LEQVDLAALMDAYGEPIPGENRAGRHRQAAYQGVLSTHAALERMSQRLAARAQQAPPRGGGRPRVTDALNFALEGLLAIWEAAGRDTATGEQGSRAFSGLALELLTAPPLGFSRRSVERRIPSRELSPRACPALIPPLPCTPLFEHSAVRPRVSCFAPRPRRRRR